MKKTTSFRTFSRWLIISAVLFATAGAGSALAVGDAYFPQDTTLELTVSAVTRDFTILAGSNVDQLVTNASSFVVTISSGQSFTIRSTDRLTFPNNIDRSTTCTSSYSELDFSGVTGTITVTPSATTCTTTPTGGGGGGGGGSPVTPTPTASPSASPTPTPSVTASPSSSPTPTPTVSPSTSSATPEKYGLHEGDVVSAAGSSDPDIYIINKPGYKRLFLNPVIFNFYGHLGGFSKVKTIVSTTRDAFVTSGLFRNCETNDQKVYGIEITGEDIGTLHWVNTTGAKAVADDPAFFQKVFCINTREFNWYPQGAVYTSVNQIPVYTRTAIATTTSTTSGTLKITGNVDWVNVRSQASLQGTIVGKVIPGEQYHYTSIQDGWYKIQKNNTDFGWVYGQYVVKL